MTDTAQPAVNADQQLLADAANALRSFALTAIAVGPALSTPYRDDPRWTPWTRWIEPEARRAHDLAICIRKRLADAGVHIDRWQSAVPGLWPEIDAEAEFLAASIAVWREIDRLDSRPEGYHPTAMDVELRQRERVAWERYRDALPAQAAP